MRLTIIIFILTHSVCLLSQDSKTNEFSVNSIVENAEELGQYFSWWQAQSASFEEAESKSILKKILSIAQALKIDSSICKSNYELGLGYLYQDSILQSFYHLKEANSYHGKVNDPLLFGEINNLLGIIYADSGENEDALKTFFISLNNFLEIKSNFATYPLANISDLYSLMGDEANAIKYSLEALSYTEKLDGHEFAYNYGYDCARLSKRFNTIGQLDSAKIYMTKSLNQIDNLDLSQSNATYVIFEIYKNAFSYHLKIKEYDEAKRNLILATNAYPKKKGVAINILQAEYYLAIGQKNNFLQSIEVDTSSISEIPLKEEFLKLQKAGYQKFGYYKKALETSDSMVALNELQYATKKKKYALFAAAKYEDLKKEKKISALEKERNINLLTIQNQKANQVATFTGLISIFLIASFIFYLLYQKNKYSKQLQIEVNQKTKSLSDLNQNLETKNLELQRFNHILSHDLKEPLRSIISFSELIQKENPDNARTKDQTTYILNSGKQLFALIEGINTYQGVDSAPPSIEAVDTLEILENVTNSMSNYITEKNATINNGELPSIMYSKSNLALIFKIIIENGLKYNQQDIPTIEITSKEINDNIHISFRDNGVGIEEAHYDQVFTIFKRLHTRSEFNGSGIGLALAQKVAHQMNSEIIITNSEVNIGTTFTLVIKSFDA